MTTELASALAAIARRLHALPGEAHRITSPLGVWLLLATVARAADGPRPDLDAAIGMPRAEAIALADRLIGTPHPVVLNAFAAWARSDTLTERVRSFFDDLPGDVTRGPMPSQSEADAWARERTAGLIPEYPVPLDPSILITLANALACKVGWLEPFRVAPADGLGPGPFSHLVSRALVTAPGAGHGAWISDSALGPVAVHVARAEGLDVLSVIADPGAAPAEVLAVAHDLVAEPQARLGLADLPLGDGPAWTIDEVMTRATPAERRSGRIISVTLPAWSARAMLDLMADPALGFAAAGSVLADLIEVPGLDIVAAQSVVARYHRVGFEAAAVTAMAGRASFTVPEDGPLRVARLRFGHPYAAVAVARPSATSRPGQDPWDGIPVFSAWVATSEEPED